MKRVTAAVAMRGERVLVARRGPGEKQAGAWEFPGGKVEPGETDEECLARELHEEFGVDAKVGAYLTSSTYEYEHGSIELVAYETVLPDVELVLTVHDAVEWVPVGELPGIGLAPADVPIALELVARSG